jgi:hypothetical protein
MKKKNKKLRSLEAGAERGSGKSERARARARNRESEK